MVRNAEDIRFLLYDEIDIPEECVDTIIDNYTDFYFIQELEDSLEELNDYVRTNTLHVRRNFRPMTARFLIQRAQRIMEDNRYDPNNQEDAEEFKGDVAQYLRQWIINNGIYRPQLDGTLHPQQHEFWVGFHSNRVTIRNLLAFQFFP